jgi:CelD/BcsL family acetyltransferase involved in cellulose biosynthesis
MYLKMVDRIEWITEEDRLAVIAADWDRLAREHDPMPFARHGWFSSWWKAFGNGRRLSVCVAWRGEELVGVLPLTRIGGRLEGPHVEAPVFRPLVADRRALTALARAAAAAAGDELVVPSLPADDPAVGEFIAAARGRVTLTDAVHVSPIVDTGGDFAGFRELTKSRWGYPLERLGRKMSRDHDARLLLVDRPEDFHETLQRGFVLENSGWKGRAGTGILSTPETRIFWRSVAEVFDRTAETRLSAITLDGHMVAFDLTLLVNRRLYLLKTGFDEEFAKLRPGLVLRLAVIERCFELGLAAHELLGDRSAWKAMFATAERPHVRVSAYARRPVPVGHYVYRRARPKLVRAVHGTRSALGRSS